MMENESLRSSKNTTVIFLSVLLVFAIIWGIVASVMAKNNRKIADTLALEKTQLAQENEQIKSEMDRAMAEVKKLRQDFLPYVIEHNNRVQAELQKKAEEAAKAAKKAATTEKKTPGKAPAAKAKAKAKAKTPAHH